MQLQLNPGLTSLIKVGALTFCGAFFGAVSLSGLPTTLDGWRAVFAPALGAAIAAEVVFLRQQIAIALSSTPLLPAVLDSTHTESEKK
jgi:hypothetical protein